MDTKWTSQVDPKNCLTEYPRMLMQRDSYTSLNGIWQYQICSKSEEPEEKKYKNILVPFALGSPLSGTTEVLKEDEILWYRKKFVYYSRNEKTLLHFDAVDQRCIVYFNNVEVAQHMGGYLPFTIDVTRFLQVENVISVAVVDRTDKGICAYGKQSSNPHEIWYTPTAGIWQSVWMEDVCQKPIENVIFTPNFDDKSVDVEIVGDFNQAIITVRDNGEDVFKDIIREKKLKLRFETFKAWTPEDPFLYDVYIETADDYIKSYFAMRKFSKGIDNNGHVRFFLNNKPLFLSGILDQGYISDGIYTYPTDEAMIEDLKLVKEMGFNMIRKHVKIEPSRWYYHCDRLGILVMQDMVNGGGPYDMNLVQFKGYLGIKADDSDYEKFGRSNKKGRKFFEEELTGMIKHLYNHPSIFSWVIFNEGWGQFSSEMWTKRVQELDQTRLIDSASGWFDQKCGDFKSRHVYFTPYFHRNDAKKRIVLLSEFGGYSYMEYGHTQTNKLFGYKKFKNKLNLDYAIRSLYEKQIIPAISKGLSGCIYTQLSDVESELNGLVTYDRKVLKINKRYMAKLNRKMIRMVSNGK